MRTELQKLAELRVQEARLLADSGKEQGAYYLAGFAIECALKACIAKKTRRHQFPLGRPYVDEVYKHKLPGLLRVAALEKQLDQEMKRNPGLASKWGVVKDWDVDRRYELKGLKGTDMVSAVTGPDGVLQWIKQHW